VEKKALETIVAEIVAAVAEKTGLTEGEARALVGLTLKSNKTNLVNAIAPPTLDIGR
jgi:hypothetical protein